LKHFSVAKIKNLTDISVRGRIYYFTDLLKVTFENPSSNIISKNNTEVSESIISIVPV